MPLAQVWVCGSRGRPLHARHRHPGPQARRSCLSLERELGPSHPAQPQGGEQMAPPPWLPAVRAGGWEALLICCFPLSPAFSTAGRGRGLGSRGTHPHPGHDLPAPASLLYLRPLFVSVSMRGEVRCAQGSEGYRGFPRPSTVQPLSRRASQQTWEAGGSENTSGMQQANSAAGTPGCSLDSWDGCSCARVPGDPGQPPGPAAPLQAGEAGERVPRAVVGLHLVPQLDPEFVFLGPSPFGLPGDSQGLCCHGYNTPTPGMPQDGFPPSVWVFGSLQPPRTWPWPWFTVNC